MSYRPALFALLFLKVYVEKDPTVRPIMKFVVTVEIVDFSRKPFEKNR